MIKEVSRDMWEESVCQEARLVVEETVSQAKQLRKEELEAVEQTFMQRRLLRFWKKYILNLSCAFLQPCPSLFPSFSPPPPSPPFPPSTSPSPPSLCWKIFILSNIVVGTVGGVMHLMSDSTFSNVLKQCLPSLPS